VVVDSAANYIYLYGMKKDWIIFRPLLARVPMNKDVTSNSVWEFFNGSGWSTDPGVSQQVMASTSDYVSPSYSVLKLQGKYYMISQDIGFLTCGYGREIYSWESNHPEGPFTNKKLLYTIEDKYRSEYMITYNATAHPEFIKNNELLISYNVNGACTNYCVDAFVNRYNADLYRPKFIRVPLDFIDPELNVPDPVFPIESLITGLSQEEDKLSTMEVYPNPSLNGQIAIHFSSPLPSPVTLELRTPQGKLVLIKNIAEQEATLEFDRPGIYFISVSIGKSLIVRKIIVL
jgi:hypothetical protein